ncbi:MAG: phosphatase [Candidatus Berkiellales bacterium]
MCNSLNKLLLLGLMICPVIGFSATMGSGSTMPVDESKTQFVLDVHASSALPHHFRMSSSPYIKELKTPPSREGLNNLLMSGSAQFSAYSLENAIKVINTQPVWIVDLRRESHGFINGLPVSWYARGNQSNLGLTANEILTKEKSMLQEKAKEKNIEPHHIKDKANGEIVESKPVEMKVKNVETEAELAKRLNANYIRIPVSDHHAPLPEEVDQFVAFVKTLPPNSFLYFHCRGGRGRTTSFMAMYDMLHNGKNMPLNVILDRQKMLGGSSLQDISDDPSDAWKLHAAIQRKDFLTTFYEYATSSEGYPKNTWQQWLKTQGN